MEIRIREEKKRSQNYGQDETLGEEKKKRKIGVTPCVGKVTGSRMYLRAKATAQP